MWEIGKLSEGTVTKNLLLQNDVIALIDDAGETVVEYKYNSWVKICQR
ncbi:hypothetical protein [Blautia luti]|nr:hypothetical protein [Blautia luti]